MKILVCLKQVPHQDARLEINSDGTWIQEENIKFEINSYDTYGLEEALRLKDSTEAEVVVASIGPDRVTQSLRTALGMGADRAIHVNDTSVLGSDSLGIARILAAIATDEAPDLIFLGLMSDDGNFAAVGPMVAELLDIPQATAVMNLSVQEDKVIAERELEGGALEVVELQVPCLLAVQTGINQVRYASLKGIMAAKKKTVDVKTAADLKIESLVGPEAAKIATEKIYLPPKTEGAEQITGSKDEIATKLVAKIKELGLL